MGGRSLAGDLDQVGGGIRRSVVFSEPSREARAKSYEGGGGAETGLRERNTRRRGEEKSRR